MRQIPTETDSERAEFGFGSKGLVGSAGGPCGRAQPKHAALHRRDYEFASQVGTKEAWDSFLALHGTGFYADLGSGPIKIPLAWNL